jgi:primosomal protein N''
MAGVRVRLTARCLRVKRAELVFARFDETAYQCRDQKKYGSD